MMPFRVVLALFAVHHPAPSRGQEPPA